MKDDENDPELEGLPELVDGDDEELDDEDEDPPKLPCKPRKSDRVKAGVLPPERLSLVTKIKESKWATNEDASKAVRGELKQFFHGNLMRLNM